MLGTEHIFMAHCNSPFNFKINMNITLNERIRIHTTNFALACTFLFVRYTNRFRKPSHKLEIVIFFFVHFFGMRLFEKRIAFMTKGFIDTY